MWASMEDNLWSFLATPDALAYMNVFLLHNEFSNTPAALVPHLILPIPPRGERRAAVEFVIHLQCLVSQETSFVKDLLADALHQSEDARNESGDCSLNHVKILIC